MRACLPACLPASGGWEWVKKSGGRALFIGSSQRLRKQNPQWGSGSGFLLRTKTPAAGQLGAAPLGLFPHEVPSLTFHGPSGTDNEFRRLAG